VAVLSARFTAAPQRWAARPAAFLGLGGSLLLAFSGSVRPAFDRVWPVTALALVAWLARRVHRLPSRTGRVVLWPVVALLTVAAGILVGTVFLPSILLQDHLGYSALHTGLAFLPFARHHPRLRRRQARPGAPQPEGRRHRRPRRHHRGSRPPRDHAPPDALRR
jgi:hypothetical protein